MARKFTHEIAVEIIIGGNSIEVVAEISFTATPYDPGISSGPPERCYQPEGGEIDDVKVKALFFPATKGGHGRSSTPKVDLELPEWLADKIIEYVSDDTLFDAADFDDDNREYEAGE